MYMKDKLYLFLMVALVGAGVFAMGLRGEEKLKNEYLNKDNAVSVQEMEGSQDGDGNDQQAGGGQYQGGDGTAGQFDGAGQTGQQDGDAAQQKVAGSSEAAALVISDDAETESVRTTPITLAFAGDLLLDPNYAVMSSMISRGGGESGSLILNSFDDKLISLMQGADIFMLNNEFPYSSGGSPTEGKQYTFRARPGDAALLKDIGTDIVSLANNHAYDYGETAFLDTLDTLESIDMPYVGAGRNIEEASKPYIFEVGGLKIAYISATQIERISSPDTKGAGESTPGVFRCMDVTRLLETVEKAKEEADFVVVYIHWGTESTEKTDWLQQEQAPQIAQAGADLIIGDHPHVLQGIDYVGDVPVYYSLGNYLFNSKTMDTCLVTVSIDPQTAQITDMVFTPAQQSGCRTRSLDGSEAARVLEYMRPLSPNVNIDDGGHVSRK
jgi:hypothetical protein